MKNLLFVALMAMSLIPASSMANENEELNNTSNDDTKIDFEAKYEDDNTQSLTVGHFKLFFNTGFHKKNKSKHKRDYYDNLPGIYVGYAQLNGRGLGKSDALSQASSSYEWGMYIGSTDFNLNDEGTFGASIGLGFSRSSYRFTLNNVLNEDANGNLVFDKLDDHPEVKKSWLRYWSLRAPVTFGYRYHRFGISAGAELEWRTFARTRAKYNGSKHTILEEPAINPLAINGILSVNVGEVCVFGRLGITDLMTIKKTTIREGNNFHVTPFMVGVGIGL